MATTTASDAAAEPTVEPGAPLPYVPASDSASASTVDGPLPYVPASDSAYYRPAGKYAATLQRMEQAVEMVLAHPEMTEAELATMAGYSRSRWSVIRNSALFMQRLAEQRDRLAPHLATTVEDTMRGALQDGLDRLHELVPVMKPAELVQAVGLLSRNLGFGAESTAKVEHTFVVAVPARAKDASSWQQSLAHEHGIALDAPVRDVTPAAAEPLPAEPADAP